LVAAAAVGPALARSHGVEDVAVIIAQGGIAGAVREAVKLRALNPAPLVIAAAVEAGAPPSPGLDSPPGIDAVIALEAPPALIQRRLEAAVRAGLAGEELAAERASAAELGYALSDVRLRTAPAQVLFVGRPDPLFLALEQAAGAVGARISAALTSYAAFDYLHDETYDAVVLNAAKDAAAALSLCGALRRNSSLHGLPTVLLAPDHDHETRKAAIERGATLLAAPGGAAEHLFCWLMEDIRRERRRRLLDTALQRVRSAILDERAPLFPRVFFAAHLHRLALAHHISGRPITVGALRLIGEAGADPARWRKVLAEIGALAPRLLRPYDVCALIDERHLAFAMPGQDLADGRAAAARVISVAECTAFAADDPAGVLRFDLSTATLAPGESGAGLLARALEGLERTKAARA
jgi:two-component system cell cycle response regulator PopA